jgi:hypothetical protein
MTAPAPMLRPAAPRRASDRMIRGGLAVGAIGLAFFALGVVVSPRQAYFSYLAAYAALVSTVLGALIMIMIGHTTNAKWFVVLRRLTEVIASTLPVLAILFIPILLGLRQLYPWITPASLPPDARARVLSKHAYLNVPFFVIRAVVYFAIWIVVSALLRRWSARQDREPDVRLTQWQRALSAGALPAVALALTFASFDWLMSLSPTWYSTIYGVYVFAGGFVAALGLIALVARFDERSGTLGGLVTAEHYLALGKLLLTFVIFWAYIAFAQLLIIWIGDIPVEAAWYVTRMSGSWGALGLVLAIGNFAIPFLLLLWRDFKKSPRALSTLGLWLLVMHYVDIYWLVMPQLTPGGVRLHWLDLASLAVVIGFGLAYGVARGRRNAPVPVGDPYFEVSRGYAGEAAGQ